MKFIPFIIIFGALNFLTGFLGIPTIIGMAISFGIAFPIAAIMHNLSGNKKIVHADAETQAVVASMTPSKGKSAIYIVRTGFAGGKQGMDITIEGVGSTQIKSGLYAYAEVDPGHHNIYALPAKNSKKPTRIQVTTRDDDVVVVLATLKMGMVNNHADLEIMRDDRKAKKLVTGAKMVVLEH